MSGRRKSTRVIYCGQVNGSLPGHRKKKVLWSYESGAKLLRLSLRMGAMHLIIDHTLEPVEKRVVGIFKVSAQQ